MDRSKALPLYIGSYSQPGQHGLHLCLFNCETGQIEFEKNRKGILNPSYLCVPRDSNRLFAVSEYKSGTKGKVTVYENDEEKPLEKLAEVDYEGAGSCYITIDQHHRHLFIANYISGSLTVLDLTNGITSIKVTQTISFEGSGPNQDRQEQSHIHTAVFSKDEKVLYCTDLGSDRLYAFNYDPEKDQPLSPAEPAYISLPPGCGPRHIACHPNGLWFYVLCELNGDLFLFKQGKLNQWIQRTSVVEGGNDGLVEAADIQIDEHGEFLYATNRGDSDQIVVFKIDEQNGTLSCIQHIHSQGKGPRCLALAPTGRCLLVANEKGNAVSIFNIDKNGTLRCSAQLIIIKAPACLKFAN